MDILILIALVFVILWIAGVATVGLMAGGGLIHVLLVIAIIVIVVRLVRGEKL